MAKQKITVEEILLARAETAPSKQLPPDPDEQNDDRASWAEQAIAAFETVTGADRDDALADLLADLMHWCDRNPTVFAEALDRAQDHYEAETSQPIPFT